MSKIIKTETLTLTSNKDEVIKAAEEQILLGLSLIGEAAEGYAKDDCPVDTGRLRGSITYATSNSTGSGDSKPLATPEANACYIGTNVEYAEFVEFRDSIKHTTGKAHFLRDAAANHSEEYKKIMLAALKAGDS